MLLFLDSLVELENMELFLKLKSGANGSRSFLALARPSGKLPIGFDAL